MSAPLVSIVFVTYERKELLDKAIRAVKAQTVAAEIIVVDDASTDGTDSMMKTEHPDVQYSRTDKNLGPSLLRNRGAALAKSEYLIFLDDDTILQDEGTIAAVLEDFKNPKIGAVAIPFINILQSPDVSTHAPDKDHVYVLHSFVAAAFAIKRSLFVELGGFRSDYFYMGEEGDLSLRLLAAGYYVKAGTCPPVHHYQPPNRISFRADFYGRRNDILFLYLNAPRNLLIPALATTILKGFVYGIKVGRQNNMVKGIVAGLKSMGDKKFSAQVRPVDKNVFSKFRFMKKHEPILIEKV